MERASSASGANSKRHRRRLRRISECAARRRTPAPRKPVARGRRVGIGIVTMSVFARGSSRLFVVLLGFAICSCRHAPPAPPTMGPNAGGPVDPGAAPPPLEGHNLLYNEGLHAGARAPPGTASSATGPRGGPPSPTASSAAGGEEQGQKHCWDRPAWCSTSACKRAHRHGWCSSRCMLSGLDARLPQARSGRAALAKEFYKLFFATPGPKPQVYSGSFDDDGARPRGRRAGVSPGRPVGQGAAAIHRLPRRRATSMTRSTRPSRSRRPRSFLNVLVNQVGYLPALAKIATIKNPAATPWTLLNAKGGVGRLGHDDSVRRRPRLRREGFGG